MGRKQLQPKCIWWLDMIIMLFFHFKIQVVCRTKANYTVKFVLSILALRALFCFVIFGNNVNLMMPCTVCGSQVASSFTLTLTQTHAAIATELWPIQNVKKEQTISIKYFGVDAHRYISTLQPCCIIIIIRPLEFLYVCVWSSIWSFYFTYSLFVISISTSLSLSFFLFHSLSALLANWH